MLPSPPFLISCYIVHSINSTAFQLNLTFPALKNSELILYLQEPFTCSELPHYLKQLPRKCLNKICFPLKILRRSKNILVFIFLFGLFSFLESSFNFYSIILFKNNYWSGDPTLCCTNILELIK